MPTGYTAGIEDGSIKTFQDYAKLCVRAFGAAIHMRDDSLTKPYEPREPDTYHKESIDEINAGIDKINKSTDDELLLITRNELIDSKSEYNGYVKKAMLYKSKLMKILEKVDKYVPPTPDHEAIKKFMAEQITSTIEWDCNISYYIKEVKKIDEKLTKLNASEIRASKLKELNKELEYHTKEYDAELQRCKEANEWAEKFFKSIEKL